MNLYGVLNLKYVISYKCTIARDVLDELFFRQEAGGPIIGKILRGLLKVVFKKIQKCTIAKSQSFEF